MKKILIVLYITIVLAFNGCDGKSNPNTDNDLSIMKNINLQNNQENEINNEDTAKVKAQVKVFEGSYVDEIERSYISSEYKDSDPQIYYVIIISNVTDTSFDFTVYEEDRGKEELVIPVSTAVFIGNGTEAAYYGNEQTFYFTFPWLGADSEVITMEISGFELLEDKTFLNNIIPGYESG